MSEERQSRRRAVGVADGSDSGDDEVSGVVDHSDGDGKLLLASSGDKRSALLLASSASSRDGDSADGLVEDRDALDAAGCSRCFPALRHLWKGHWFLALACLFAFPQTMIASGLFPLSITSISRQFGFTNTAIGALPAIYDASVGVFALICAYIAHRWHKPRILGYFALILGLGSFLTSMPGFLRAPRTPLPPPGSNSSGLLPSHVCTDTPQPDPCEDEAVDHAFAMAMFALFVLGEILTGVGAANVYTFIPAFIDDNVDPKKAPMYLSIFFTSTAFGPAIGFLLGGAFLTIYVTLGPAPDGLDQDSALWVGAWWLGFILCTALLFMIAPVFLSFPKHLPGTKWIRDLRVKSTEGGALTQASRVSAASSLVDYGDGEGQGETRLPSARSNRPQYESLASDFGQDASHGRSARNRHIGDAAASRVETPPRTWREFFSRLKHDAHTMLTNATFMGVAMGNTVDVFIISGLGNFLPAFVESQYHVTSSEASFYSGISIILGVTTGVMLGGWFIKRFKWDGKRTAFAATISALLSAISLCVMLMVCQTTMLAGVNAPYGGGIAPVPPANTSSMPLWEGCNSMCHCMSRDYRAVCDPASGTTFFSPCAAGCVFSAADDSFYGNCSCVTAQQSPSQYIHGGDSGDVPPLFNLVTSGKCKEGCDKLYLFLFLVFVAMVLLFFNTTPIAQIHLRCVTEQHRTLALALASFLARIIGATPAPVIMGAILDNTCLKRDVLCDGSEGACLEFENNAMSQRMFAVVFVGKLLSVVFYGIGWVKFPRFAGDRLLDEAIGRQSSNALAASSPMPNSVMNHAYVGDDEDAMAMSNTGHDHGRPQLEFIVADNATSPRSPAVIDFLDASVASSAA